MGQRYTAALPAQTAGGATSVTEVAQIATFDNPAPYLQRVEAASPTLVTGVATNNVTINVRALRGGTPLATNLASITLANGTNLPAEQSVQVPNINPPQILQAGDVIDVQCVQNGTGLALPAGVQVELEVE